MVEITMNDRVLQVEEQKSVLEVARANGIKIPTLCYHPALKPSGSCKLCAVEVTGQTGRQLTVLTLLRHRCLRPGPSQDKWIREGG